MYVSIFGTLNTIIVSYFFVGRIVRNYEYT